MAIFKGIFSQEKIIIFAGLFLLFAGIAQPLSSYFQFQTLNGILRRNILVSSSSSPFSQLNGFDFNVDPKLLKVSFLFSDGQKVESSISELTRNLNLSHKNKIYWTYPIIYFAAYGSSSAKKIIYDRFCTHPFDPVVVKKLEPSIYVKTIYFDFETPNNATRFEIICAP